MSGQPCTLSSAAVSIELSWGPASFHSAPTRPAVITVTRTQPGTSPRSSRRRGAVEGQDEPDGQER